MTCSAQQLRRCCSTLLLVALLVAAPRLARASGFGGFGKINLPYGWAVGPSLAYVYADSSGLCMNVDLSYTATFFTASLNGKLLRENGRWLGGPQAELTGWLFVNLGGGVGYLAGNEHGPVYHVFAGVPIPLSAFRKRPAPTKLDWFYVEPYYRLNFFQPGGLELIHEVGVFVKVTKMLTR